MNLWDRALSEFSVKQLAALRNRWKFPGNVVSWSQLVAKKPPSVQIIPPSEEPGKVPGGGRILMGWLDTNYGCPDGGVCWGIETG